MAAQCPVPATRKQIFDTPVFNHPSIPPPPQEPSDDQNANIIITR